MAQVIDGAALVVGGLVAAPFAGLIVKRVRAKPMTWAVGIVILALAAYQFTQILGAAPSAT